MIEKLGDYYSEAWIECDNTESLYYLLTVGFKGYENYTEDELRDEMEGIEEDYYKQLKKARIFKNTKHHFNL